MKRDKRAVLYGILSLVSIIGGGGAAFLLSRGCSRSPEEDAPIPQTADVEDAFYAPETIDGAVKSVIESWPDGSDKIVEYHRRIEGKRLPVRKISYYNTGSKAREIILTYREHETPEKKEIREWHENSELHKKYSTQNNNPAGEYKEYWPNGFWHIQGTYKNGKKEGVWLTWNENGIRIELMEFHNGKPHGMIQRWDNMGHPLLTGQYEHGEKKGDWKYFDREHPPGTPPQKKTNTEGRRKEQSD